MLRNHSDPSDLIIQDRQMDRTERSEGPHPLTWLATTPQTLVSPLGTWDLGTLTCAPSGATCPRASVRAQQTILGPQFVLKGEEGTSPEGTSPVTKELQVCAGPKTGRGEVQRQDRPGSVVGGHWPRRPPRTARRTALEGTPNVNSLHNIL